MRIVISDSDKKTVKRIEQALEIHIRECFLTTTDSGQKSLDITRNDCPDLVVIGAELCDMSGFELIKQIRCFSEVPILFLFDGDDRPKIITKASNMGVDRCIVKPISQPVFIAYLKSLLRSISSDNKSGLKQRESQPNRKNKAYG